MNPCKWIFIAVLAAIVAGDTGEKVQNMGLTFVDKPKLIIFQLSNFRHIDLCQVHCMQRTEFP